MLIGKILPFINKKLQFNKMKCLCDISHKIEKFYGANFMSSIVAEEPPAGHRPS